MLLAVCIAFVVGTSIIQFLPALPTFTTTFSLLALSILAWRKCPWLIGALVGFLWAQYAAFSTLQSELPSYLEGETIEVEGTIRSIPSQQSFKTDFTFAIDTLIDRGKTQPFELNVNLAWYSATPPSLSDGDRWRFHVRLKRPHGLMNPGGFDYEKWLFQSRIRAVGYVYDRLDFERIQPASSWRVNHIRLQLADWIDEQLQNSDVLGLMKALTLGMRVDIRPEQWTTLQATGTSHLMAISGLHVGLVAGGVFALVSFCWRRIPSLVISLPTPLASAIGALIAALHYSALSGFAIPTQRAMLMLCLLMLGILLRKPMVMGYVVAFTAVCVVLLDPFATWSASFWLSFIAVIVIMMSIAGRLQMSSLWHRYGRVQWVVFIGLLPLTLGFFNQIAWLSPLINVFAVPLVGLLIVPIALISILLLPLWPSLAGVLLNIAAYLLNVLWAVLDRISQWDGITWVPYFVNGLNLTLALLGALVLLLPRGMPGRYLGVVGFLPLFLAQPGHPNTDELWLTVLDVGQGLAIVVRTHEQVLVYDTGPKLSETFDAGRSVLLPFLQTQGISQIDRLIISHAHNDHDGGVNSFLEAFPVKQIQTGDPFTHPFYDSEFCQAGTQWRWQQIEFEFLHPKSDHGYQKNNASCVLQISVGAHRVLLTGDIEEAVEQQLVHEYDNRLQADILIAPHHGSLSSSTMPFIAKVAPKYVVFATGYRNRFGFPNQQVLQRYHNFGARHYNTSDCGAVQFKLRATSLISPPSCYRSLKPRFWQH